MSRNDKSSPIRALRQFGVLFCSALCTGSLILESTAQDDELQVVTTILPISQFTLAVVGDRATVTPETLTAAYGPEFTRYHHRCR